MWSNKIRLINVIRWSILWLNFSLLLENLHSSAIFPEKIPSKCVNLTSSISAWTGSVIRTCEVCVHSYWTVTPFTCGQWEEVMEEWRVCGKGQELATVCVELHCRVWKWQFRCLKKKDKKKLNLQEMIAIWIFETNIYIFKNNLLNKVYWVSEFKSWHWRKDPLEIYDFDTGVNIKLNKVN